VDTEYGESGHRWPVFLPDDHHFLYTAYTGACCPAVKPARIRIGTLDSKDVTTLMEAESSVLYASGHLLFTRNPPNGPLMAQPFDPELRRLTGDAFQVVEQVASEPSRYASVSVSDTGVLIYAPAIFQPSTQLTWVDRDGKSLGTIGSPASYQGIDLAPDDNAIAVAFGTGTPENRDIWLLNATNAGQTHMTFDPGNDEYPVWSPDGLRIAFQGNRQGALSLRQKLVEGTADDELLNAGPPNSTSIPTDWSSDGRFIAFNRSTTGFADIWVMPTFGDRKPYPIVQTTANETNASFSPDGRWFAYQSIQSGGAEIYVQPFPPTSEKHQISKGGGFYPRWRADGKELFYRQVDGTLMATAVNASGSFTWDSPRKLFSLGSTSVTSRPYAVAKDGKKFLVAIPQSATAVPPLTV